MHPAFLSTSLTDIALKCWSLASKLRLPAQKHAPINLTMTLKTVDLILFSKGLFFTLVVVPFSVVYIL